MASFRDCTGPRAAVGELALYSRLYALKSRSLYEKSNDTQVNPAKPH